MSESNQYVDIYSGTEVQVLRIKDALEREEIPSIIQNYLQSGNSGGFFAGTPTTVRLKVRQQDFDRARTIIEDLTAA